MLRLLAFFLGLTLGSSLQADPQDRLFKYRTKVYGTKDVPDRFRQQLYEVELEHYNRAKAVYRDMVFDLHVKDLAEKQKKTVEEVATELLKVDPVTEKDAKKWYQANKHRIGTADFSAYKAEIMRYLSMESTKSAKDRVVDEVIKTTAARFLVDKPDAPKFEIATEGFPAKGSKNPQVTVVEFADYSCPHCASAWAALQEVMKDKKLAEQVKVVYMDFPLRANGLSTTIAHGAACAHKQSETKFWEYHDLAFGGQDKLNQNSPQEFAKKIGLNVKDFGSCMADPKVKEKIMASRMKGEDLGVNSTPAIYLNGVRQSAHDAPSLKEALNSAIKKNRATKS